MGITFEIFYCAAEGKNAVIACPNEILGASQYRARFANLAMHYLPAGHILDSLAKEMAIKLNVSPSDAMDALYETLGEWRQSE